METFTMDRSNFVVCIDNYVFTQVNENGLRKDERKEADPRPLCKLPLLPFVLLLFIHDSFYNIFYYLSTT
mgnify:FL=1